MPLPGRVPGSAVAITEAPGVVWPHQPSRVGRPPGLGMPVAECAPDRRPVARILRPAPAQLANRVHRSVRVVAVGTGPAARFEGHHEWQADLGELGAEPVLVPEALSAATARNTNPPYGPGSPARRRPSAWYGTPGCSSPWRSAGAGSTARIHQVIDPLVSPHRGDVTTTPLPDLPYRPSH